MSRLIAAASVLIVCGAAATPLLAHHGTNISYDRTKQWR